MRHCKYRPRTRPKNFEVFQSGYEDIVPAISRPVFRPDVPRVGASVRQQRGREGSMAVKRHN